PPPRAPAGAGWDRSAAAATAASRPPAGSSASPHPASCAGPPPPAAPTPPPPPCTTPDLQGHVRRVRCGSGQRPNRTIRSHFHLTILLPGVFVGIVGVMAAVSVPGGWVDVLVGLRVDRQHHEDVP